MDYLDDWLFDSRVFLSWCSKGLQIIELDETTQMLVCTCILQIFRIAQELTSLAISLPLNLCSAIFVRTVSVSFGICFAWWLTVNADAFYDGIFNQQSLLSASSDIIFYM